MSFTPRRAVIAILVLVSAIFLMRITSCGNSDNDANLSSNSGEPLSKAEISKAAIEKVLKQDSFTSFNQESINSIIRNMRQINLADCPNDFSAAYIEHIHAWGEVVTYEEEVELAKGRMNSYSVLAESFVRGLTFDATVVSEANDEIEELQKKGVAISARIRRSFETVQDIAIAHGAKLPPPRYIEWKGTCSQEGLGEYPMHMTMEVGPNGQVIGTLHWKTLNDSTTKFRGKIQNGRLTFTENELLSTGGYGIDWLTGNGVVLPVDYEAHVSGSTMSGTATHKNLTAEFSAEVSSGAPAILEEF